MSAVVNHACPDCHGKGGTLPNGAKYCNCPPDDNVVYFPRSFELARLEIARQRAFDEGCEKLEASRKNGNEADAAFRKARQIAEQMEVLK